MLKELALFIPNFVKLMHGLIKDPRVPRRSKIALFFLAGYLVFPIDIIPDFIPGIGQLDDIVLAALVLDGLINKVGEDVVRDHWHGSDDVLNVVKRILATAAAIVPGRLSRFFSGRASG